MAFHWKMWKSFSWKKIVFSTKIEFVWTLFCVRRCPFRETMDEAAIKPSTDFKGNKLKFDLTTTFLSTRRNSWPSVAYETTLRHTTSGIFEPFDDDEDDYAANVDNVEFVPSKSPCCNGRTFDFNVRTNDFRTNVVRPFWSSPTRQSFRQNAIDVCEDSGQGRCYKTPFAGTIKLQIPGLFFLYFCPCWLQLTVNKCSMKAVGEWWIWTRILCCPK